MSKKSNSSKKNHTAEKEMRVMTNAKLQFRFDAVADDFDPSDEISVENANHEMHKNWRNFLEAGFDVDSVVRMMSLADIWENYDELLAYDAELDATKLFLTFKEFFDEDFAAKHWDELVNRGVSPDLLADRCYANCGIFNTASLKAALKRDVSAKKAFQLIKSWFVSREEWPEEQIEILELLHEHGLPKADIKEWLDKHTSSYMEDYIVEHESGLDFYKKFDMDNDDIIDRWFERNGWHYFDGCSLSELPDAIDIDAFLACCTIDEIIEASSRHSGGFEAFVADYLDNGGDIDVLAERFMDCIGDYPSNSSELGAMFDLVRAGASADIIDPVKYLEEVDVSRLNDDDAKHWYDCLKSEGYDDQLINKFLRKGGSLS